MIFHTSFAIPGRSNPRYFAQVLVDERPSVFAGHVVALRKPDKGTHWRDDGSLYVILIVPSVINWEEKELAVAQTTGSPQGAAKKVKFAVTMLQSY